MITQEAPLLAVGSHLGLIPHRAVGLRVCAVSLVGTAKGVQSSCPQVSSCLSHRRQYRPHREPNARLTVFSTIPVTTAKHKSFEEPSDNIHDCKSRCDSDKCKRELLGLEQFVDARQSLVNVDLAPVSPGSSK